MTTVTKQTVYPHGTDTADLVTTVTVTREQNLSTRLTDRTVVLARHPKSCRVTQLTRVTDGPSGRVWYQWVPLGAAAGSLPARYAHLGTAVEYALTAGWEVRVSEFDSPALAKAAWDALAGWDAAVPAA